MNEKNLILKGKLADAYRSKGKTTRYILKVDVEDGGVSDWLAKTPRKRRRRKEIEIYLKSII